jgi:hypothetical protein
MDERLPRKLAAIFYADVAEYSRLTGEDEDATHIVLKDYLDLLTQIIKSHRGKVMLFAGDAVLAMFESVVDAVSSATDAQKQLLERNTDLPDQRKVPIKVTRATQRESTSGRVTWIGMSVSGRPAVHTQILNDCFPDHIHLLPTVWVTYNPSRFSNCTGRSLITILIFILYLISTNI